MVKKTNRDAVLALFFRSPTGTFHLREMARQCGISAPTVSIAVAELEREGIVSVEAGPVVTAVRANLESSGFIRMKRVFNLTSVYESGLVDRLMDAYDRPRAIILFGSYSRGEDVEASDIDIAVATVKRAEVELGSFEEQLERPINVHEVDLSSVSEEFRHALCNGIILEGVI